MKSTQPAGVGSRYGQSEILYNWRLGKPNVSLLKKMDGKTSISSSKEDAPNYVLFLKLIFL
jgi:hypothetical protein